METTTAVEPIKRGDLWKPKFSQLVLEEGLNFRTDYGDMKSLIDSIREAGVLQPLRGYRKGAFFCVTDGHRRYTACKWLFENEGLDIQVSFVIESKGTNVEQRIIEMFLSNDGKPFSVVEMAEGVKRLVNYGWTEKAIALKLGKSESAINKINQLNHAPQALINLINAGTISASLAIKTIQAKEVDELLDKYNSGGFNPVNEESEEDVKNEDNTKSSPAKRIKEENGKPVKIKPKDLEKPDSIKIFKNLATKFNHKKFTDQQGLLFDVISKIVNNEYTEDEIIMIFEIN